MLVISNIRSKHQTIRALNRLWYFQID